MNKQDVKKAAHTVWASYWASAIEENGGSLPPGAILNDLAPRLDDRKLLPVFHACYIQMDDAVRKAASSERTGTSWWRWTYKKILSVIGPGRDFETEVDKHIPPEDQESYLYRVIMGCLGHGISPTDDGEEMPDYMEHPCDLDDSPWHELAWDAENMAQPSEAYVKKGGLKCPVCGSVVSADSPDVGGTVVTVNCWCEVCKSRWTDEYVLHGYSALEVGVVS